MTRSGLALAALGAATLLTLVAATVIVRGGGDTALANTLTVTKTADTADGTCDSDCSLREALLAAQPGDIVSFNIPGTGPHVIQPLSPLPALGQQGITLDGYTQPGAQPNTAGAWEPGDADIRIVLDGSLLPGPEYYGVWVGARNVTLRGVSIVNFADEGIRFGTFPSAAIQGNYIGVWPDGATPGPNGLGIDMRSSQAGNAIGGTNPAQRNVISGNIGHGIHVSNSVPVVIAGNFVGTDASGDIAIPNGGNGINLAGGPGSTIGGSVSNAGNLVSGNEGSGIAISTADTAQMNVKGNRIGTTAEGDSPLPNGMHGVLLDQLAHDITIGGEFNVNEQNIIAYNGGAGVALTASAGVNNYIDPNETHSNVGLGTDLLIEGVTENDLNDPDTGPNSLMNFPILTSATYDGVTLVIQGSLNTVPNDIYNMFFFANSECDPTGYGEGERFIGSYAALVDGTGTRAFQRSYSNPNLVGAAFVTASASDPESTSEFSPCIPITITGETPTPTPTPSPTPTPTPTPSPTPPPIFGDVNCDDAITELDALTLLATLSNVEPPPPVPGCPDIGSEVEGRMFGDVDCNGAIEALDPLYILYASALLPSPPLPTGCPALPPPPATD